MVRFASCSLCLFRSLCATLVLVVLKLAIRMLHVQLFLSVFDEMSAAVLKEARMAALAFLCSTVLISLGA
jgi:hypothetical protein